MPGKVNPVIPEVVMQVAAQVIGNDTAVTLGGQGGMLELNTMLPLIARNLLESISLLTHVVWLFGEKCVAGIVADREKCASNVERSLALVTYLVPALGYDKAAELAGEAHRTGKTVRQVVLEGRILTEDELDRLFARGIER